MNFEKPVNLHTLTFTEITELVALMGEKPFRARQIMSWLYRYYAHDFESMTSISKIFRKRLADEYILTCMVPSEIVKSEEGTEKFLFPLSDGAAIESVLIPDGGRLTLCISTQAGCRMGCRFCMTGKSGYKRNLTPDEIVGQLLAIKRLKGIKGKINLVFMGMGEPLENYDNLKKALDILMDHYGLCYSPRKITVSTAGIIPGIKRLGRDTGVNLTVSVGAPDEDIRTRLMPVNKKYPLNMLMDTLKLYPLAPRQRITFAYTLIHGINDSQSHALKFARMINGINSKVNLIAFNPYPGCEFQSPSRENLERFQSILIKQNLTVMIRESRGGDIDAACGQLHAHMIDNN